MIPQCLLPYIGQVIVIGGTSFITLSSVAISIRLDKFNIR